jgi:hypothetical protein
MPADGPFYCEQCDPQRDITAQVLAERDQQMEMLRARRSSQPSGWSVWITCPAGHDVVIDSTT